MADGAIVEEWRTVMDFPDYEVSNLGRVRRRVAAYRAHYSSGTLVVASPAGFILATPPDQKGYPVVGLYVSRGKSFTRRVATLVCTAFHGDRPHGHDCAHFDGSKDNNRSDNLRWATRRENNADKIRHGTAARGSARRNTKLTENDVRSLRTLLSDGMSQGAVALLFGVPKTTINNIVNGRSWGWLTG